MDDDYYGYPYDLGNPHLKPNLGSVCLAQLRSSKIYERPRCHDQLQGNLPVPRSSQTTDGMVVADEIGRRRLLKNYVEHCHIYIKIIEYIV